MNKVKIVFCLFLAFLSLVYLKEKLNSFDLFKFLISDNKGEYAFKMTLNKNFQNSSNQISSLKTENNSVKPLIYFFNTHQTEEYGSNFYSITPTVVTVSEMLKEELLEDKINSLVEDKSIKEGLDRYGYDYSYSYRISLEYLKEKKSKFSSLEYFFDIHRDSVKGDLARTTINGKTYAKIMFLLGKNHDNYKANLQNIKIMEKYLNENYPGILRDTYIQKLYSYNQEYSSKMFLVEVGGVDNTLEELYNTSIALGDAISYFVGRTR